jgi:N utilization substance protein A
MSATIGREVLQIADAVAREKGIEFEEVIQAMEEAIQKIGRTKYGLENDIRASIDRKTGDVSLGLYHEIVEEVTDVATQISLEEAKQKDPDAEVGGFVVAELPPVQFGRIAAQSARQVISQRVRGAERERQYAEFKDRVGDTISGIVRRNEYGNYIVDIGKCEALLRRDECIPRENFRPGDKILVYIMDVRPEPRGPQVFLSRTHPHFMAQLFRQEVPEIADGLIEVVSVARDPGSRAKLAVFAKDSSIDPVGSCVGMRGSRVQAVVNELQGERVDIVVWSEDLATFVVNALAPASISKVIIDEEDGKVDVVVPEDQQSLAIGRRGQNVRLASSLVKMDISIITEEEEEKKRSALFRERAETFTGALDVDEVIGHLLVAEGFTSIEEIAEAELEELSDIEGFDENVAKEIHARAVEAVKEKRKKIDKECADLGVAKDLIDFKDLSADHRLILAKNDVKTLDDLADLAGDELLEILGNDKLSLDEANDLIMKAREHWFDEDKK